MKDNEIILHAQYWRHVSCKTSERNLIVWQICCICWTRVWPTWSLKPSNSQKSNNSHPSGWIILASKCKDVHLRSLIALRHLKCYTRHRQIGNCWRHAWYIKDGLIWRETKVHKCLSADSMCSEKFTVFRTRSSRKTVSLSGAYDDGSIFSRQMEAIELSLNYFATSREKSYKHLTISWVFQCSKVRLNEQAYVHLL